MATGISYRRVYDGSFSPVAETPIISQQQNKEQSRHGKSNAVKNAKLPEISNQDLPVTCGSFRSVQFSLTSFFKRGKTLNLDFPRDHQRSKQVKVNSNRQQIMKSHKRIQEPNQKDQQKVPISRERSRSASYNVAWRERFGHDSRSDVAATTHNARRADSAREHTGTPGSMRPPVHGYIPRNKIIQYMEREKWSSIMEPTWEPVETPRILQRRQPRSKSDSKMPNSILKRHLTDSEDGTARAGDGNNHGKHACFKKHVDVYYFQPTDRLASLSTVFVDDAHDASDANTKRSRHTSKDIDDDNDTVDNRATTSRHGTNSVNSNSSTQPKLEWTTEVTRLPLGDAQDHLNVLRLKVKVNCRYIREKTAVKALSGGRAFVVTIYQQDVDVDGTTVVCQHVKKLTVPVTIDPYKVKAHVHKDGLLTVDAPVVPECNDEE